MKMVRTQMKSVMIVFSTKPFSSWSKIYRTDVSGGLSFYAEQRTPAQVRLGGYAFAIVAKRQSLSGRRLLAAGKLAAAVTAWSRLFYVQQNTVNHGATVSVAHTKVGRICSNGVLTRTIGRGNTTAHEAYPCVKRGEPLKTFTATWATALTV